MTWRAKILFAVACAATIPSNGQQIADAEKLEAGGGTSEAFAVYLAAYHRAAAGSPESDKAWAKVVDLAYRMDPVPEIPAEADRHFGAAMAALQSAPDSAPYAVAYSTAIAELTKALQAAPWWPIAYFDLGMVQEITGRLNGALGNLQIYLQLYPDAPDAREVGLKIADLQARQKSSGFPNSLGMRFAPVPGMVAVFAFSIWDTRVIDYRAFASDTRRKWTNPKFPQSPVDPAVFVSWEDAKAFCDWLTARDRTSGWLTLNQHYRLPTDAEWSVAVGLPDEKGETPKEKDSLVIRAYPWGRQWPPPPDAGNYGRTSPGTGSRGGTLPVGSFRANAFGLYDMGGNVWQWCGDYYDPASRQRVLRGGSFADLGSDLLLSAARTYDLPDAVNDHSGFRCVIVQGAP